MTQHVVLQALLFRNPGRDIKPVNNFFKEQGWGKLAYVMQFKTLPGFGGEGGRNDVVFVWSGTQEELGTFSVGRFMMGADSPRWLEDYVDNNRPIIPGHILTKLKKLRAW